VTPATNTNLLELMNTMLMRCALLPLRLARARSPLALWQEQVRFMESITHASLIAARTSLPPAAVMSAKRKPSRRRLGR
jgi:hypothetical protein